MELTTRARRSRRVAQQAQLQRIYARISAASKEGRTSLFVDHTDLSHTNEQLLASRGLYHITRERDGVVIDWSDESAVYTRPLSEAFAATL